MKSLFLLLLTGTGYVQAVAQQPSLRYTVSADTSPAAVHVVLTLKGSKTGQTVLQLPDDWASETKLFRAVRRFAVSGGKALVQTVTDSAQRTVHHAPGADLTVSYDLQQDWVGPVTYPQNFRAVIQPAFFQFTGYSLLVLPKLPDSQKVSLVLDWSGLPAGWAVGNSFHAGNRRYQGVTRLKDLRNSVFTAGDFRLQKQLVDGKPVHVAIRGRDWQFGDTLLQQRVAAIIAMERRFWNDRTEPYYFVSLIPFDGRGSANGSALHQTFMLAMTPDQTLDDWLLAHEYFHRWNGTLIELHGDIEQEHAWLSEGFTEYYTYKLLLEDGLISPERYLRKANEIIAAYYQSPVRNKDRKTVGASFWSAGYKDLPYKQGFVYALFLDNVIRETSGGRQSLDSVMHDLYALSKTQDSLREADFTRLASRRAGKDLSRLQQRYIDSGETIPVLPALFGDRMVVSQKDLGTFDAGFAIDSTIASGAVAGVRENTAAWAAGLRNGQQIRGYSISRNDLSQPLEVVVDERGTKRTIRYMPISVARVPVPQLERPAP